MERIKSFIVVENKKDPKLDIFTNIQELNSDLKIFSYTDFVYDEVKKYELAFIIESTKKELTNNIIHKLSKNYHLPIIIISNGSLESSGIEYLKLGASDVISYDHLRATQLVSSIEFAIERQKNKTNQIKLSQSEIQLQNIHALGIIADMLVSQISNNLDGIIEDLPKSSKSSNKIVELKNLIKQVRDYLLIDIKITRGINLQETVQNCYDILLRLLPDNISLNLSNNRSIDTIIDGDPSQIKQAITNLVINSIKQLSSGGTIKISFSEIERSSEGNQFKKYIKLELRDSKSLSPVEVDELFNPSIAVKKSGFSGLSLPSVFAIMKNHLGYITVESESRKGTCYNLFFPKSEIKNTVISPVKSKNKGIVLVIEDDYMQSEIMKLYLEAGGYTPVIKFDISEAESWFSSNHYLVKGILVDSYHAEHAVDFISNFKTIKPEIRIGILASPDYPGESISETLGLSLFLKPTSYPLVLSWLSDA